MKVALLAPSLQAITNTLLSHEQEGVLAGEAAAGSEPVALHVTGISPEVTRALLPVVNRLGLDLHTGDGWVALIGARSRLAVFARPWTLPPQLAEFAIAVAGALPGERVASWHLGRTRLSLDTPLLVGILNCTPDSFSDGGRVATVADAVALAEAHLDQGASMLDVGGQSTRPGAKEISAQEETERVLPVLRAIRHRWPEVPLALDTVRASVVQAALECGIDAVNDVSSGRCDPALFGVVAGAGIGIVLMHSRGTVADMATYDHATYDRFLPDVVAELGSAVQRAQDAGVFAERIAIDPGFGFSKTVEQNLELAGHLSTLRSLGRPLYVGPSRKRFLGDICGRPVNDRDRATAAFAALMWGQGAQLFRVHNVGAVRDALWVAKALDGPTI